MNSIKETMIGERVEYSLTPNESCFGIVRDKILMANTNATFATTGYLIENENTGELKTIQSWRVLRCLPGEVVPMRAVKGGYRRTGTE